MKKLIISICLILCTLLSFGQFGASPWTAANGTYTVPAGVTSIKVTCYGGGGGGGGAKFSSSDPCAGGGGGGACSVTNSISVTPGQTITVAVGAGGSAGSSSGGNGGNGGESSVTYNLVKVAWASGGTGGSGSTGGAKNGGAGGSTGSGTIKSGGTGGNGYPGSSYDNGGGGGGGAGTTANGSNGTTGSGSGLSGGAPGGNGGATGGGPGGKGSAATSSVVSGSPGSSYGGGGGGAAGYSSGSGTGGTGATGAVIIEYTVIHCVAPTSVSLSGFATTICSGDSPGTGTATPTGGSGGSYTYLWYKNGISTGVTTATYNPGSLTANTDIYCAVSTCAGYTTNSPTTTIIIGGSTPSQPGAISGNLNPCNTASEVYSVPNVAGVTYNWSFPAGWAQTGGGTSNSVTVTVGSTSGTITVTPSNSCGTGPAQTLGVTVNTTSTPPTNPGAISGNAAPCYGCTQVYSVTNVPGVNYNWTFPAGWAVLSGTGTNSISVSANSTPGTITVTPSNTCGNGSSSTLSVTPQICTGTIPWNAYPGGTGVSYLAGTAPFNMNAVVTQNNLIVGDGAPKYTASDPGTPCYIPSSLALYANTFSNITDAYYNLSMLFNPSGNGGCYSISFSMKDINANETSGTFLDVIEISAIDGSGAAVPATNIAVSVPGNTTITTSGNTQIIRGHNSSSEVCSSPSTYSTTSCGITSVTVTPPAGIPLQRINIRYRPAYGGSTGGSCSPSCSYYSLTGPTRPAYQYISISDLSYSTLSGCVTTLPVELLSFTGKSLIKENVLTWSTASETNNAYFDLERSANAVDFETIGRVNGAGNANVVSNYSYSDDLPLPAAYYRLKQTDFDGAYTYSELLFIKRAYSGNVHGLKVWPNPSNGMFYVSFDAAHADQIKYRISDMTGRCLVSGEWEAVTGQNYFTLELGSLKQGLYYLQTVSENQEEINKMLIY